jgi:hypothetical protein
MAERSGRKKRRHILVGKSLPRADEVERKKARTAKGVDCPDADFQLRREFFLGKGHWNSSTKGIPVCDETRRAVLTPKDRMP